MTAAKSTPAVYVCPDCGFRTPYEVAIQHDAARDAISRCMRSHGELGAALMTYISLHRPRQRAMTWEKTARLISDVLDMVDAGYVVVDGQRHTATRELWIEACAAVKDASTKTLTLPLDGHGYILRILVSLSTKARAAGIRERDAAARGETPVGYRAAHAPVSAHATPGTRVAGDETDPERLARYQRAQGPAIEMPEHVKAALRNFGKRKSTAVCGAPTTGRAEPVEALPAALPKHVPTFAEIDGKRQLVEVLASKGRNVTVRLLEAATGHENTVTIPTKALV